MSDYAQLDQTSAIFVDGGGAHIHVTGDSQATYAGPSANNNNYIWSNGLLAAMRQQWDYLSLDCVNSSAQNPARSAISGTNVAYGSYTLGRDQTTYSAYSGVPYITDGSPITFAANIADGTLLGSGFTMNGQGTIAAANFNWPHTFETGQPWYYGSHTRAALVYWDVATTLRQFTLQLARVGGSANNASAGVDLALPAATGLLQRSAFTAALADQGNYQTVGGGNYPNNHELRLRLYSANGGYDETGLSLMPLSAIFARSDSAGNFTTKRDGGRLGFSMTGRAGAYVSDYLLYANQSQWQNYFSNVMLPTANQRAVLISMFGHNADGATEVVGGRYTALFRDNWITLIRRQMLAMQAAFPGVRPIPLVIAPWRSGESGANNTAALARSLHERAQEVATAVGGDFFSFPALFNFGETAYTLHPQQYGIGAQLWNMIYGEMQKQYPGTRLRRRSSVQQRARL